MEYDDEHMPGEDWIGDHSKTEHVCSWSDAAQESVLWCSVVQLKNYHIFILLSCWWFIGIVFNLSSSFLEITGLRVLAIISTWGYVSGGCPWTYSGNDQDGSWPGPAEFARQYSNPQIFQAPASLITIASGEIFLWSIFALSCRKARPSEIWRSPYLISMSNILWERSCSGTGLGSWSWTSMTWGEKKTNQPDCQEHLPGWQKQVQWQMQGNLYSPQEGVALSRFGDAAVLSTGPLLSSSSPKSALCPPSQT